MPFASINPTNPRTNPWNFHKKIFWELAILKNGHFEKRPFWKKIFKFFFFLLHLHENQPKLLGYQGWVEILMIILVYSKVCVIICYTVYAIHTLIYSQPIYFSGYLNMFKMNYVAKLGTKSHEGINIKQRP